MYQTENGLTENDVTLENETDWLSQEQIAELFQRKLSITTKNIRNTYEESELNEKSNVQFLHIANSDTEVVQGL